MARDIHEQIDEIIKEKDNILICLPTNPSSDAISSGLALYSFLEKLDKRVKIVSNNFTLPANHSFLPKSGEISKNLTSLRDFIISVDVKENKIEEIKYDIADDKLNIYLSPKNGFFTNQDITTSAGNFAFNLIFVLDSIDLEALGELFNDNADFFYQTPIVNIDHHPANEHFGQMNLIDITATSTSELIYELVDEINKDLLDEYMATNLLTGIISKTKSFKTSTVTPKSLAISSYLIDSGARREEIVKNLYQTKSLRELKIWGYALAKIQVDSTKHIVWSNLTRNDFMKADCKEADLEGIIDELMVNTPNTQAAFLAWENVNQPGISALVYTPRYLNSFDLFRDRQPVGSKDFTKIYFENTELEQAENLILEKLKTNLAD